MAMKKLKFAGAAVAVLGIGVLVATAPGLAQQPAPNNSGPPGPRWSQPGARTPLDAWRHGHDAAPRREV